MSQSALERAHAVTRPAYAKLLPAERFLAWRAPIGGGLESCPVDVAAAASLDAAVDLCLRACSHKDHFTVLQTLPSGKRIEHVYYVKQKAAKWIADPENFGAPKRVHPLAAELRFSRAMVEFAPAEPWRAVRGCDVVGVDRSLVEG